MSIGKLKLTGIYGGTFNPIHNGHLLLGRSLVEAGLVEELWFLVSPQNPFKVNQELMAKTAKMVKTVRMVKMVKTALLHILEIMVTGG